jgi:D-alanyl-D-alanine carboxypeptidase/D-alanyl-D-alanine-endopeptidase (penicillin-binding protein 4)
LCATRSGGTLAVVIRALTTLAFAIGLLSGGPVEAEPPGAPPVAPAEPVIGLQYKPLTAILSEVIADPLLTGALVGARVDSLTSDRTLYAHNPDLLINPASVSKVYSTAAALALLHPEYRFATEVYANHKPERGLIRGPIYLKGYGDPYLVNERLTFLADELRAYGIERIEGPIVLDDTWFDEVEQGPGWSQDDSSRPYAAPMGALSLNFNAVSVSVLAGEKLGAPARLELMPDSDHFDLDNKIVTAGGNTRVRIEVDARGNRTRVLARGTINLHHPGSRQYRRITSPSWYTGRSFRQALVKAGIKVRNGIRRGEVPRWADKLYVLRSPDLGELVRKVNKRSQNFMAEQLYKVIGAELLGPPASWYKGQQAMAAFLAEEVGIQPGSYVLHNGSGLNDVNRVTASQTIEVLRYMWSRFDLRPDFVSSLAVSGADGTVANRFRQPDLRNTMRLKTGSLENVRSLAGYVHTLGGETLAFCLVVSRYQCPGYEVLRLINRFAAALARADVDHLVVGEVELEPIGFEPDPDEVPIDGGEVGAEETEAPFGEKREPIPDQPTGP